MLEKKESLNNKNQLKAFLVLILVLFSFGDVSADGNQPSHLDKTRNPAGCSGCHKGHGKKGTAMLRLSKDDTCFTCHGLPGGKSGTRTDVYSVFKKRSNHPVAGTSAYHSAEELLPEQDLTAPRHVACQDCHNAHALDADNSWKKVKGYSRVKGHKKEADEEYELCYKCHSDSANLPKGSANKREEFAIGNASFHPIEAAGRNRTVPSLNSKYNISSKISCTDCHGNNESFGARGPHGSDYEHILNREYATQEGAESLQAYSLCYSCHDRRSILANESFQKHKEHIVYYHLPCAACHTPHGSQLNPHLISFGDRFVYTVPMASYAMSQNGRPLCFLKCHIGGKDVMHDNLFYSAKKWP